MSNGPATSSLLDVSLSSVLRPAGCKNDRIDGPEVIDSASVNQHLGDGNAGHCRWHWLVAEKGFGLVRQKRAFKRGGFGRFF